MFTGKPGGVFRGEKHSNGGDVAGLADAAERSLREDALLESGSDEAAAVGAFSLDSYIQSFSVGNAMLTVPSAPSHGGNVQRSMW